jgi:probable F420-dependent oxidoreductase
MKFGYLGVNSAAGIRPGRLAAELESRGYESMWMPEHSHIPADRRTPYPAGGELPDGYYHMMSPLVSLAAAAEATNTLTLATGICLALEHDLVDLATMASTLDVLSEGRLLLGIGAGWNAEELANHRPDLPFRSRYGALIERVIALRTLWADDPAACDGRWDQVASSWVYPKPLRQRIPIALGLAGSVGLPLAAAHADEWCPIDVEMHAPDGRMSPSAAIQQFRLAVAGAGRDPTDVPITIFAMKPPRADIVERYGALGVHRVVFGPMAMTQHRADDTLRQLDTIQPLLAPHTG